MKTWEMIAEAIGEDDDDELASFVGQVGSRPKPGRGSFGRSDPHGVDWGGNHDPNFTGADDLRNQLVQLSDGRYGTVSRRRPDGAYDILVYSDDGGPRSGEVLDRSEFELVDEWPGEFQPRGPFER